MLRTDNYKTTPHWMFDYGTGWHFAIWSAPSEQCRYKGCLKNPNKPSRSQSPSTDRPQPPPNQAVRASISLLQAGRLKFLTQPGVKSFKKLRMSNLNTWN